jgi:CBS domain-containing protein
VWRPSPTRIQRYGIRSRPIWTGARPCGVTVTRVARTAIQDASDLLVADVIHKRFSAMAENATVREVREWFAESPHRRMAFLCGGDGGYLGSLTPADLAADLDPGRPALEIACSGPTVTPDAPATMGRDLALATDARRVPVVDQAGTLVGVVAVTDDLAGFCGTS